jgi:regulator of RNase E activity RraA
MVTDGGFRDTPELEKLAFRSNHNRPAAPTNLTLHQAIEINGPIGCGDVPVFPGDVVVGDDVVVGELDRQLQLGSAQREAEGYLEPAVRASTAWLVGTRYALGSVISTEPFPQISATAKSSLPRSAHSFE